MKKAIFLLIVLAFFLLYYAGVFTKKETLPFSKEFFSIESPDSIDRRWDFPKSASLGPKELEQLYQLKLDKGIRNVPILSYFLIRESKQALREGDADRAVRMTLYSVKISPDLPQPYFELARALWKQNPFQLPQILSEVVKGEMAQFRHFPSSLKLFYNLFYFLSNAILMTFIVFGIVIMVKYFPLYFYDIRKNLTQEMSRLLINSLKILVLLIPFFLRLDILWAFFYWSVLLWGYVTKREKQLIILFLIVLVYFPFFLRSSSAFLDGPSSDILFEIHQVNHEDGAKGEADRLKAWLTTHPDDAEVLFSLGLAEKRQGRYLEAEEYYRQAVQRDTRFSEAFSNLGNVYLARKQTSSAIASYQQATDIDPHRGAYYFNLYRAYSQETFLSGKIDKTFQRARQLDPQLIDYYTNIDLPNRPPNFNRLVIDEVLTPRRLWQRFLEQFIGKEGFLFRLFKAWFEKIPSRFPFLAPILFLGLLMGLARYSRSKRFLTRCPMCGSPTYRFYLGTSEQEFICFNCHRIFIQKEKLHPKIVEKKSLQVKQFQRENHLISRFLSFFLVGFGYLWREQVYRGLFFLFIFFILILRLFYWEGAMPSSFPSSHSSSWRWIFWGGVFLLFYILSVRHLYHLKPKFETEVERTRGLR
ncbi:MAG: tetratricopeptide repeat protein [Syntrophaceae bacterium]|nr:tetratricopeptide repeat protein [Syntrophaceae bacterium]